jgi:hypothetical protein
MVHSGGDLPVTAESASDRQQQWEFVVRRSFGISDLVANNDARETLIRCFEDELQVSGWQSAPRAVAQPIVDALMVLEVVGDLSDPSFTTRDGAHRVIAKGIAVIDPEHLVYEAGFEYPPEIVAAAQQMLLRVEQYVREQSFGD